MRHGERYRQSCGDDNIKSERRRKRVGVRNRDRQSKEKSRKETNRKRQSKWEKGMPSKKFATVLEKVGVFRYRSIEQIGPFASFSYLLGSPAACPHLVRY